MQYKVLASGILGLLVLAGGIFYADQQAANASHGEEYHTAAEWNRVDAPHPLGWECWVLTGGPESEQLVCDTDRKGKERD